MEESQDSYDNYSFEKEASFSPSHIVPSDVNSKSPQQYVSSYVLYDSPGESPSVVSDELNWDGEGI